MPKNPRVIPAQTGIQRQW